MRDSIGVFTKKNGVFASPLSNPTPSALLPPGAAAKTRFCPLNGVFSPFQYPLPSLGNCADGSLLWVW